MRQPTVLVIFLALTGPRNATAIDYEWVAGGVASFWTVPNNWSPVGTPEGADNLVLTGASAPGPQTIDLVGPQQINFITKNGVVGDYTFVNTGLGALEILASGGNGIVPNAGAGALTFDTDLQFAALDNFVRINVVSGADAAVVNGNVESSAASGTTTLELTSRDLSLDPSVLISGIVSDGSSGARIAVHAGFDADSENHRGVVEMVGLNTYTGPTAVRGATLRVNSIANLGVASALGAPTTAEDGTIHLGARDTIGIQADVTGTLVYTGGGHSSDRDFGLLGAGGTILTDASVTGSLNLSGDASAASTSGKTLELGGNSPTNYIHAFGGVISDGAATVELKKAGTSAWNLTGSNTYSGDTHVEDGFLFVSSGGRLPDATTVTVDSGATLLYNIASADAIYGLQGDGVVDLRNTLLVLGNSGGPAETGGVGVFNGILQSVTSTGSLEKRGSGVFTFAGTGNYVGATEVENGEMIVTGAINNTTEVRVVDGPLAGAGMLSVDGGSITNSGVTSIDAGAELNVSNAGQYTTAGLTTVQGTLRRAGTGVVNLNGDLLIDGGQYLTPGGDFDLAAGHTLTAQNGGQLNATSPNHNESQSGSSGGTISTAGVMTLVDGTVRFDGSHSEVSSGYQGGAFNSSGTANLSGNSLISLRGGDAARGSEFGRGAGGKGGTFTSTGTLQLSGSSSIDLSGGEAVYLGEFVERGGRGGDGGTLTSSGNAELLGTATIFLNGGAGNFNDSGNGHRGGNAGTFQVSGGTTRLAESAALYLAGGRGGVGGFAEAGGPGGDGGNLLVSDGQLTVDGASIWLRGGVGNRTIGIGSNAGHGGNAGVMQVTSGAITLNTGALRLQGGQGGQGTSPEVEGGDGGGGGLLMISGGDFHMNGGILSLTPGNGGAGGSQAADGIRGAPGEIIVDGGNFRQNGGQVTTGLFRLVDPVEHYFNGGRLTVDTFDGTLNQQGGFLAPGTSPGTTNITGDYQFSAGVLEIELAGDGGMAGTDFDQVDVDGTATLAGNLAVSLLSFTPDPLDSFAVLTASSLSGSFGNVMNGARLDTLGGEGSFLVSYDGTSNQVVLSDFMASGLLGDFDDDGDVDGADLLLWQTDPSVGSLADWEANYGEVANLAATAAVPEPSASLLVLCAVFLQYSRRTRRS